MSDYDIYRWNDHNTPGRKDINGVEWWACDPMPTWYRWEDGELFQTGYDFRGTTEDPRIELSRAVRAERKAQIAMDSASERVKRARDSMAQVYRPRKRK